MVFLSLGVGNDFPSRPFFTCTNTYQRVLLEFTTTWSEGTSFPECIFTHLGSADILIIVAVGLAPLKFILLSTLLVNACEVKRQRIIRTNVANHGLFNIETLLNDYWVTHSIIYQCNDKVLCFSTLCRIRVLHVFR